MADLPVLQPPIAEGYITIEGRAEERVRPTDVRVVLAVTSEGETAPKCQQTINATIERLRAAWSKMGIGPERVVVDFIAVLPRYEWSPEKHGTLDAEVEKKAGFRMQTNVHLAARGEAEARAALAKALEQGITDIIAFDYWSKDLDGVKVKVQGEAVQGRAQQGRRPARRTLSESAAGNQRARADNGSLSGIAVPLLHQQLRRDGDRGHTRGTCPTSTPIVRGIRTIAGSIATVTCSPASCR